MRVKTVNDMMICEPWCTCHGLAERDDIDVQRLPVGSDMDVMPDDMEDMAEEAMLDAVRRLAFGARINVNATVSRIEHARDTMTTSEYDAMVNRALKECNL